MKIEAASVEEYLAKLPEDRRAAVQAVRETILKNLDSGYQESLQYGMIAYCVPHSLFPPGYHCDPSQPLPFASLGSQRNHMAVYLMSVYGNPDHEKWFRQAWAKTGKKLDMGKSCVRFKKVEDLALDVIGESIRRVPAKAYVEHYQKALAMMGKNRPKPTGKKKPPKSKK
ncbi:MAG TPA: DUF1801 domain-containing protein [Planctomycetota bacterium]|nr:DUF1801 domain-containing protein [Planctomycetota bacterium]